MCVVCGHVYDEAQGAPEDGIAPGTRWEDVPDTWTCPDCGVTKDGVVVVSHDRVLNPDHTRDAAGKFLAAPGPAIVDLTYEELRQYDVGRIRPGSEYAAACPKNWNSPSFFWIEIWPLPRSTWLWWSKDTGSLWNKPRPVTAPVR